MKQPKTWNELLEANYVIKLTEEQVMEAKKKLGPKEKFTPGPWSLVSGRVESATSQPIAKAYREMSDYENLEPIYPVERDANMRLISAAPELYAALEALLKAVDSGIESDPELWRRGVSLANKALAKARGES